MCEVEEIRKIKCSTCNYRKISYREECNPKIWCQHPDRENSIMNGIDPRDFMNDTVPVWCPRKGKENV